jgi:polar amino acid transport system permease protein
LPDILLGLWLNIRVLAICAVLIPVVGLLIAGARTLRGPVYFPLRALAAAYTDFFRGIPLIILLYLVGFGVPGLKLKGVPIEPFVLGTVALVLTYSAYVSEVFRAGIESVHPSQRAAARSLGLTYGQTLRTVVLPQAVRRVIPPLLNDFVALQKDVGLISVLGANDAVRYAQIHSDDTFNFTPYMVAGLLFIVLAIPTIRFTDWVTARANRRQQASGAL